MTNRTAIFRRTVLTLLCVLPIALSAASISGEYFINIDKGIGKCQQTGQLSIANGSYDITIPADQLAEGMNILGVRVCNKGQWSTTLTSAVWKIATPSNAITDAEYFWDTDPGIGNGIKLSTASLTAGDWAQLTIPVSGIDEGAHLLGVRVCTESGWSTTHTAVVHFHSGSSLMIEGVEYFWGDDPGAGEGTAVEIEPDAVVTLENLRIPFPSEDADYYTLGLRARTSQGWGSTMYWTRQNTPASSITLSTTELTIENEQTCQLEAEIAPESTLFKELIWSSADPEIATIDAHGKVTAMSVGETLVTVRAARYDNVERSCRVVVTDKIGGVTIVKAEDIKVFTDKGVIAIRGTGYADGEITRTDGVAVAAFNGVLPQNVQVSPGIYLVTVNGVTHKVAVN